MNLNALIGKYIKRLFESMFFKLCQCAKALREISLNILALVQGK